ERTVTSGSFPPGGAIAETLFATWAVAARTVTVFARAVTEGPVAEGFVAPGRTVTKRLGTTRAVAIFTGTVAERPIAERLAAASATIAKILLATCGAIATALPAVIVAGGFGTNPLTVFIGMAHEAAAGVVLRRRLLEQAFRLSTGRRLAFLAV